MKSLTALLFFAVVSCVFIKSVSAARKTKTKITEDSDDDADSSSNTKLPCSCGVFLDEQFFPGTTKIRPEHENEPVFSYPIEDAGNLPSGVKGRKMCTKKCIELVMKYMNQGPDMLCAAIEQDFYKQKAHMFIQNAEPKWHNAKLNSGREITCKDGMVVKN